NGMVSLLHAPPRRTSGERAVHRQEYAEAIGGTRQLRLLAKPIGRNRAAAPHQVHLGRARSRAGFREPSSPAARTALNTHPSSASSAVAGAASASVAEKRGAQPAGGRAASAPEPARLHGLLAGAPAIAFRNSHSAAESADAALESFGQASAGGSPGAAAGPRADSESPARGAERLPVASVSGSGGC